MERSGRRRRKPLAQGIEFGFQMLRVAYNAKHADQIELKEETDPKSGIVIRSLVNDKGFPPGFRPSFAVVKGYLVLATSPEAIRRFTPPVSDNPTHAAAPDTCPPLRPSLARLSPRLTANGSRSSSRNARGHQREADPRTVRHAGFGLELIDSAELISRPDENGLQLAVKIKPAKPLKK